MAEHDSTPADAPKTPQRPANEADERASEVDAIRERIRRAVGDFLASKRASRIVPVFERRRGRVVPR